MLKSVKFVTGNPGKLREAREILGIDMEQADVGDLEEIQTIHVEELIRRKAEDAYGKIRVPLIVEDTGLAFKAWNGLPGALIKWFLKTVGNDGLLRMLGGEKDRSALAQCFIAYHDGVGIEVVKGEIAGTVALSVRGENGFGWDKIFIPEGHNRTFGEMASEEKNSFSMRRRAFENLKKLMKQKSGF
ncbi:MAG: non-canonical purine NTP pyrophosphatase [bacterium]|nr:MAG: non-canonical purine NTP pyrophosphatase [bacterium]